MCKLMEDRLNEREYYKAVQVAAQLLMMDKLSYDEIAKVTGLPLSDIEDIARQLKEETRQ